MVISLFCKAPSGQKGLNINIKIRPSFTFHHLSAQISLHFETAKYILFFGNVEDNTSRQILEMQFTFYKKKDKSNFVRNY